MARLLILMFFLFAGITVMGQQAAAHEPTSATDSDVKLHNTRKSRFLRSSKSRTTERQGSAMKDSKYKAEARPSERHGKSVKRSRGNKKLEGEGRVFRRHGGSASNESSRKYKVKRSLGKTTE